ncbi:ribosome biogenesis protein YTM1 [Diplogelasinospora grovesii]|uniref:Ribosome biogenesis protein YTM1 n=1 Tax=Diplogelasinospora grovesii TaxID=303347 RepID=A0AAN6NG47_9PEZI|nr:ribosome biogenesis protein YTM1 [Diplogelasinospora grovesii]
MITTCALTARSPETQSHPAGMEQPELGPQVRVTFTTTEADLQLDESKRQLLVPADIRRYGLSRILNSESMLDPENPIPFDFLVNGSFLQSSLEDYLKDNGLSLESNVTLQYVRSLIPPVFEASFQHDDWVSSVDVLSESSPAGRWSGSSFQRGNDRILSASFDGLLRIWNASGQVLTTSPSGSQGGHTASVKSARWLSNTQVASAGDDRTVRVWTYSDASSASLKPTLELYGHTHAVDSVEVDGSTKRILTASQDGAVGFWTTSKTSAPQADASLLPSAYTSKRRKVANPSVSTPQRGPLAMMKIHDRPASAAVFDPKDKTVAYSASWDHSVKTIDLTTSTVVSTVPTSHPLFSLAAIPRGASAPLLAAGTSARHITMIDPRASATTTAVMTLRGHKNMVVSLSPSPDNEYSLVSGSHDGTCRIWDLRSVRQATKDEGLGRVSEAVYIIERESMKGKKQAIPGDGCKVFDVVWDKQLGIFSAGEDKTVQANSGRNIVT